MWRERERAIEDINEFFSLDFSEARLSLLQFYYVKQIDFIVFSSIKGFVAVVVVCLGVKCFILFYFILLILFICDLVWI